MKKFVSFITALVIISANLMFAGQSVFADDGRLKVLLSEPIGTENIRWIETTCTIVTDPDATAEGGYRVKDLKCINSEPSAESCKSRENSEAKFAKISTDIEDLPEGKSQETKDIIYCRRVQVIEASSGSGLLQNYVGKIYKWAAGTIGIVAVLMIVVSGIELITSDVSGDVDSAKNRIMQSLAGLAILFLSAVILYTINPNFFF